MGKPVYSQLKIANLSLAEMPAGRISSLNEDSLEARELALQYDVVLAELLEEHDWRFAVTRATLAETDNALGSVWAYAYALPADLAFPVAVVADAEGAQALGESLLLVGQTLAPLNLGDGLDAATAEPSWPYAIEGAALYTNLPGAVLKYVSAVSPESVFYPLFVRYFVLSLAARCVLAVTKSETRQAKLLAQAELARNVAIAASVSRAPQRYDHLPDEISARYL